MRVAYVCADPGVPVFGTKGCSVHVQEVLRALVRRGALVDLFAARLGGDPPSDLTAVAVHRLPSPPKGDIAGRERAALDANRDLNVALRRAGPFDLIYERYSLWSEAGMAAARAAEVPGLLEVNAPLIQEQAEHRGLVDREAAEKVACHAFGDASALIAVSEGVAAYLDGYPAAQGRVHVVPNGVDPGRFPDAIPAASPADPGVFTVGFLGTLKPWHGLPVLADAFDRLRRVHPRVRLLVVGDGSERAALEADVAARGLGGAVHMAGTVAPGDVPNWLASMDVGVAPYPDRPDFYFSPLKVFEYMAAGLAVVASRIGQLERVLRDGIDGLLCTPGDAQALAGSLGRLLEEPGLRRRLGRVARESVLRDYTWDAAVGRILALAEGTPSRRPSLSEATR